MTDGVFVPLTNLARLSWCGRQDPIVYCSEKWLSDQFSRRLIFARQEMNLLFEIR